MSMKLLVAAMALVGGLALAGEREAETCIRTRIWDGYAEGWAVRTATKAALREGEYRVYALTLYAGMAYRFLGCADKGAADVDLVLHDADGLELARDETDDGEPTLAFTPEATGTYYVAVYAARLAEGSSQAGVSMAATYQ